MASLEKLPEWAKIEREQVFRLEGKLYIKCPDGVGFRGPIQKSNQELKTVFEAVAWWAREFERLRLQREATE